MVLKDKPQPGSADAKRNGYIETPDVQGQVVQQVERSMPPTHSNGQVTPHRESPSQSDGTHPDGIGETFGSRYVQLLKSAFEEMTGDIAVNKGADLSELREKYGTSLTAYWQDRYDFCKGRENDQLLALQNGKVFDSTSDSKFLMDSIDRRRDPGVKDIKITEFGPDETSSDATFVVAYGKIDPDSPLSVVTRVTNPETLERSKYKVRIENGVVTKVSQRSEVRGIKPGMNRVVYTQKIT